MTLTEAISLIRPAIQKPYGVWADIGAGTGMFTQALMSAFADAVGQSLWRPDEASADGRGTRIYAVDKSPHALWALKSTSNVEIIVVEADFTKPLDLPLLDGIVMANALHYAHDHLATLKNIISSLRANGTLILVEYDTETPNPPWVPHPVSLNHFETLCAQLALLTPQLIHRIKSRYGDEHIYSAWTRNRH